MDSPTTIVVAVVIVLLAIAAALLFMRNRKTSKLQAKFGPEYSRTIEESGGRREAETLLHQREKRVEAFEIKPISPADSDRYLASWKTIQAEFVDDPKAALTHADELVGEAMTARGYPVTDFEQRSADLSVDHPVVVQNYRAGHEIALKHESGDASTEDLRQAMIHFRTLFDELVVEAEPIPQRKAS